MCNFFNFVLSLVEGSIQQEREAQDLRDTKISMHQIALALQSINTDDEDEEIAFKAWKKRELKESLLYFHLSF